MRSVQLDFYLLPWPPVAANKSGTFQRWKRGKRRLECNQRPFWYFAPLHKGAFRDALALRYGWRPTGMPSLCACGKANGVEQALSCCKGGHVIRRHNEIRDVTASLLGEVTQNVEIEPSLQPLTGEVLRGRGGSMEDAARVDVKCTARFLECTSRRIFGCEGFQSICVVQPEQADEGSVPSTRKREAKSVQPTGSRG